MCRSRTLRSRIAAVALLGSLQSGARAFAQSGVPRDADGELAPARALFAEALQDEQEGRVALALEKFRRVRDVRDTAAVEYRIASCEEGLGRLVAAAASYTSAIRLGEGSPLADPVTSGARERLASIEKRIGHLTLAMASPVPTDREVFVDGAVPSALSEILLDPGPHLISARAPGTVPFQREVTLLEGARLTVSIRLAPSPSLAPPAATLPKTVGWSAVAGGVALVAASGIVWVLRESDIGSLNRACPAGECPPTANESSLEATRSRAIAEGPIAVGLAVAGALASGVGLFLLLRPSSRASVVAGLCSSGAVVGGTF
jgi:hypothetical protein